jgi:hypothetical protein
MIRYRVILECDKPLCGRTTRILVNNADLAREQAATHGWTHHNGEDRCPEHPHHHSDPTAQQVTDGN